MGKRSAAASRERRIVKRHQVRLKKRAEWARKRNLCLGKTPVSALQRLPGPSHLPSHIHEAVCECSEHFSSAVRSVKDNGGFTTSPPERVDVDSALSWSSSVDEESPPSICNRIKEATEEELPVVVVDEQRAIEVHLKSGLTRGSQVLKLSTEEFFQRVVEKEEKKLAIKCLRNKVENLQKELVAKEHLLRREKEEAISTVRTFWRDQVLECGTHGGKMLKAALQKK